MPLVMKNYEVNRWLPQWKHRGILKGRQPGLPAKTYVITTRATSVGLKALSRCPSSELAAYKI